MKLRTSSAALFASALLLLVSLSARPTHAGLYDDEKLTITTGDIADQDYWWAKFDNTMLDLAIKQHQPEGRISVDLASSINRLNDLVKKYPKHEELKKWLAHAEEINKKIDPNAPRGASFNTDCPWDEANYAQLWVNFHYAKMLIDAKDYETAYSMLTNVMQNYDIMLKPDRMKDYPDDLRKWVVDNKAEADKMVATVKEKTSR